MALYKTEVFYVSCYGRQVKFKQYYDFEYALRKPNITNIVDLKKQNVSIKNKRNTNINLEKDDLNNIIHISKSQFGRIIKSKYPVRLTTKLQPVRKRKRAIVLTKQTSSHIKNKFNTKYVPSNEETTYSHTTSNDQVSNSSTSDRQSDVGEENNYITSESDLEKLYDSDDDDLEVIEYFEPPPRSFFPVDEMWQRQMCNKLNIDIHFKLCSVLSVPLTKPLLGRQIVGDGNCFFRCLSFWITGTEDYHLVMRAKIVEFYEMNETFTQFFCKNGENVKQYLQRRKIGENGVWATEEDIFAAAAFLDTFIYVYSNLSGKWDLFKKGDALQVPGPKERCIYLFNDRNAHYMAVVIVG